MCLKLFVLKRPEKIFKVKITITGIKEISSGTAENYVDATMDMVTDVSDQTIFLEKLKNTMKRHGIKSQ